jgi:hypothetical protein
MRNKQDVEIFCYPSLYLLLYQNPIICFMTLCIQKFMFIQKNQSAYEKQMGICQPLKYDF